MDIEYYDYMGKIMFIGDSGVGKTSILLKFIKGDIPLKHLPTIAIDFKIKIFECNGTKVKLQLWDTAGQERFNTMTSNFYRGNVIRVKWYFYCLQH